MNKYFLTLVIISLVGGCVSDTSMQETLATKRNNFLMEDNSTYYLIFKSKNNEYKQRIKFIEKHNRAENIKLRINSFVIPGKVQEQFILIKKFQNLADCWDYKKNIETNKIIPKSQLALPVSIHNYRVLLAKEKSFSDYASFFSENYETK